MFEKFTERARRVVVLAQEEARLLNHGAIGTEHLLLGIVHEGRGVAARTLEALGIRLAAVRRAIEREVPRGASPAVGTLSFSPRAKKSLENALRESLQLGHHYIGTEHILLGLMRTDDARAARVLTDLGATLEGVRAQALAVLADRPVPPDESGIHNLPEER
ncbi:MAG TPA: Clp protease N-terminal domain-containing protein [Acidimicrobiia bacterium]|nr:Clp protease N-terminal domain-containing protein [Acidimicrobiia bacterium]